MVDFYIAVLVYSSLIQVAGFSWSLNFLDEISQDETYPTISGGCRLKKAAIGGRLPSKTSLETSIQFSNEQWLRRDPGCRCLGEESRMNPLLVECLKDRSLHVRIRPWISIHMFASHLSALSKILSLWWRTLWPKKNFKTNKLISIYPGNLIWVLKMMLWQNVTLANIWLFGVST